ncbi:MAG: hypothetical protein WC370_10950 [Dehalococcoidales bacterium]|jgi:hypothetical protein
MNRPPLLMHVRIKNKDTNFGLWLPLFLLFPVLLVVLLALSPLILIGLLITWPSGWGKWAWRSLKAAFVSLWNLRGLDVDIKNREGYVRVSVI